MGAPNQIIKDWRYIDKSKRGTNGFKWFLDDYKWHNNHNNALRAENIPHIFIKEMQPDYAFNYGDLVDEVFGAGGVGKIAAKYKNVLSDLGIFGSFAIAFIQSGVGPGLKATARLNSTATSKNNLTGDEIDQGRKNVARLYSNYINAEVLGTYQIPYMGDMYLETVYDGWSQSGADRVYGKTVSKFLDTNTPYTSIGIPEWTLESGGVRMPKLKVEFNLYNSTIQDLFKNYTLLHSLASGSLWLQSNSSTKKSPNLFNVSIPGRFAMPFSSMTVTVKAEGMIRRLHPDFQSALNNSRDAYNRDILQNSAGFMALSNSIDPQFPDVFNVTLNIQSLLPNNFNSFILYAHGTEQTKHTGTGEWHSPTPMDLETYERYKASIADTVKSIGNLADGLLTGVGKIASSVANTLTFGGAGAFNKDFSNAFGLKK